MQDQAREDDLQAALSARNCLILEERDRSRLLNVGTADEPRMVSSSEAWQHNYAMLLLMECDGDYVRINSAGRRAREESRRIDPGSWRVAELARVVDLCDQAAVMIEGAGAVHDDKARRRLVAGCQHETMITSLGVIPGVAEDSAAELRETLRRIDEEP